jgi:hypothetical protein
MKRGPYFKSPRDVREFLGTILRETYRGEITENRGRACAYIGQTLISAFATCDFEERLNRLEGKIDG